MYDPEHTQGRNVSVFRNADFQCFICQSGRGLLVSDPAVDWIVLPVDAKDEDAGEAVFSQLGQSKVFAAMELKILWDSGDIQRRVKKWEEAMCASYSYESTHRLYRKMLRCNIKELNGTVTLPPLLHYELSSWKGMRGVESIVLPASCSCKEVGRALRAAFDLCGDEHA